VQQAFKKMALVPKHEFEAQEALLTTLETQIADLEARLSMLESAEPTDLGKPN
jgi:BMFP domain-containing protein YqiC